MKTTNNPYKVTIELPKEAVRHIIAPYEDYAHIEDMTVIDDMAYNFWVDSEYTIDVNGNWYDEEGREVTIETKDLIRW